MKFLQNIGEALAFNDLNGNPSKISRELAAAAIKGLPKDVVKNIEEIEPNHYNAMTSPSSPNKKGVGVGVVEYKAIGIKFTKPIGKKNLTDISIGIRKRTSGPGTGYICIGGYSKGHYYEMKPHKSDGTYAEVRSGGYENHEAATEFWNDDPESAIARIWDKVFKPALK